MLEKTGIDEGVNAIDSSTLWNEASAAGDERAVKGPRDAEGLGRDLPGGEDLAAPLDQGGGAGDHALPRGVLVRDHQLESVLLEHVANDFRAARGLPASRRLLRSARTLS